MSPKRSIWIVAGLLAAGIAIAMSPVGCSVPYTVTGSLASTGGLVKMDGHTLGVLARKGDENYCELRATGPRHYDTLSVVWSDGVVAKLPGAGSISYEHIWVRKEGGVHGQLSYSDS